MIKNEKIDLAILLLISFILSTYLFFRTYVISTDGALQYIPMAKYFTSGFWSRGLREFGQQPLYPFFIAVVFPWVNDFEVAGKLVSTLFGVLLIFPVYFLGKKIFDQKTAFLATLALAVHPYIRRFSGDVLKESTYLFLLAATLWFTWKALESEKIVSTLFIPIFSALAYLVRPDGIEVLLVVFFYVLWVRPFDTAKKKWEVTLCLVFSSFVLFLPYLLHLKGVTGAWALSKAKSVGGLLGIGMGGMNLEISLVHKILFSLKILNLEILAIFHPLYLFLLIIGVFRKGFALFKNGEGFLLSFFILHYLILFLLVLNFTDWSVEEADRAFNFSGRHVLPLLLISIYWVGEGFLTVHDWGSRQMESRRLSFHWDSKKKSAILWVTLSVVALGVVLPKTLKPQRYQRLTEKQAGVWIKNQSGTGTMISTTIPRVAFYADGNYDYVDLRKESVDQIKTSMVGKGVLYLVIQEKDAVTFPEKMAVIEKNFIEATRYGGKGMEKIIVYQRIP